MSVFLYKNCISYIGREFISNEGYKCEIIEDTEPNSGKIPSNRKYKVQFENGYIKILSYATLSDGNFSSVPKEFSTRYVKCDNFYNCICSLCNYKSYLTIDEMVEHLKKRHNLYNN